MHNHRRARQPRIRKNDPALTVILVVLAFFTISGGVGLALLIVGQNQRGTTPQITPTSKAVHPSGLSPQQLYARITSSPPAIIDSLTHADMQLWVSSKTRDLSGCIFNKQGLVIQSSNKDVFQGCMATTLDLSDFAFQAKMTILKGNEGGMTFRFGANTMSFFTIDRGGNFSLLTNGNPMSVLLHRSDPSINVGAGQSNVLTMIAQGYTFLLYTNGHYLGQVTTRKIPASGNIGLIALGVNDPNNKNGSTTVVFSDMRVWKL